VDSGVVLSRALKEKCCVKRCIEDWKPKIVRQYQADFSVQTRREQKTFLFNMLEVLQVPEKSSGVSVINGHFFNLRIQGKLNLSIENKCMDTQKDLRRFCVCEHL
jgi:hypothetical protein